MSGDAIITRFAPSPSGELHLGNAKMALFNFLLARRAGGRMVLRIEDTDAGRSGEAFVDALCIDLEWLGLPWDEGPGRDGPHAPYRQSQRGAVYARFFAQLEATGEAYPCYCTPLELELARRVQLAAGQPPRYAGTCRNLTPAQRAERVAGGAPASLRFRVPQARRIEFDDLVHGPQSFLSDDIGDFVVRRENGSAAFFFSNAIDDALMGITHVLRGEDHLTNTPRQLLLLEALKLRASRYGHLALLLGPDGSPLSKRHGATSVRQLRQAGYAPLAVCNHLFRLGHSTPSNELLSLPAMAQAFDSRHLQRSAAHFDEAQLRHWQSEWVRGLSPAAARGWLMPTLTHTLDAEQVSAFFDAVLPNVVLAQDAREWEHIVFDEPVSYEAPALSAAEAAGPEFFAAAAAAVGQQADLSALRAATGRKGAAFFMPLRAALTGRLHGPELAPLLRAMPAERVRARLLHFSQARS
jgi:glutamyl-tRNA synthetase